MSRYGFGGFPLFEIDWLFRSGSLLIKSFGRVDDVALLEIIEGSPKEMLPEKGEMMYRIKTGKVNVCKSSLFLELPFNVGSVDSQLLYSPI